MLHVTFSKAVRDDDLPLDVGVCRTESMAIPGGTEEPTQTTIQAEAGDTVVTLRAEADCWVSIGNPNNSALLIAVVDSTPGANRRPMAALQEKQFHVSRNHRVAVSER